MLSLFDHITTKKPQFDAYPFFKSECYTAVKRDQMKNKKSYLFGRDRGCSDELGFVETKKFFVRMDSGLVLTDTDLFGQISYFCDKLSFCLDEYVICYDE